MISSLGSRALKAMTPQTSITVDRSRCVRHRCRQNDCRRCMDICPSEAISWSGQGLTVSSPRCTQCLHCLAVCPTEALNAPELSLLQMLSDLSAHPEPVLGCPQSGMEAHARISCLARLADPELLMLLALVFREGLQINLTGCGECPRGAVLHAIRAAWARLSEISSSHKLRIVCEKEALDYRPISYSRRELFGFLRNRSKRTARVVIERLEVGSSMQSYGAKRVPLVRTLLLRALEMLPEDERERISSGLLGNISFTSTCSACGGCAGICPTGAIEPANQRGQTPEFHRGRCVGCGSCSVFCRKKGVESIASSDT